MWVGPAAGLDILEEIMQFVHIFENETTIFHLPVRNLITTPTKPARLQLL